MNVAKQSGGRGRERFLQEVLDYLTGRLLRNPRLLYLWSKSGGNLQVFFEELTRKHYNDHILKDLGEGISGNVDAAGPFGGQVNESEVAN